VKHLKKCLEPDSTSVTSIKRTSDFIEATEFMMASFNQVGPKMVCRDLKIVAIHEEGHALASWLLPNADIVYKVQLHLYNDSYKLRQFGNIIN